MSINGSSCVNSNLRYGQLVTGIAKYILRTHRLGRYYFLNKKSIKNKIILKMIYVLHRLLCSYAGCFIPFGAKISRGLVLPHGLFGVFISKNAQISFGVTILHHVTIGSNPLSRSKAAPKVGAFSFIGAGAKVVGNVNIEPYSLIKINQVVTRNTSIDKLY